ncbi:hypothetical protein JAAARDRAFT_139298, partial [Jaapia argillacea MUCL 33604]
TPNDFMREWLAVWEVFLQALIQGKAPPADWKCIQCGDEGILHCTDCFAWPLLCSKCCRNRHRHLPYHRVERWMGEFFQPGWLSSLGVEIRLGHRGDICPCNQSQFPEEDLFRRPYASSAKYNDPYQASPDDNDGSWRDMLDAELLSEGPQKSMPANAVPKLCGRTMTIVDVSGVHEITVNFCACGDRASDSVQLLDMGLYLASVVRPRTAFTFQVLDDFTRHNLECKTNTHKYYETIRRATRPAFPWTVPDRHREMMRCVRQWQHLKTLKWSGFGYGEFHEPRPGELGLFCPACPQVGVNLPDGWEKDAERMPWLFARQLNMDRNFKAEQTKRKYPEDDCPLTNGSLFLVEETRYKAYCDAVIETPQKATCHDHKAQSQSNTQVKHLAVTGIVAVACACHSAFCLGSCANLQKGERQINMDYILCQALKLTKIPSVTPTMVLYDIICQYGMHVFTHFLEHIQFLDLDSPLDITMGIGLFHVHGHQDSCGPRFSPNYIVGASQVDGEVIETLWARLNEISISCWGMGNGHQTETLDIHMLNSNWEKLLGIVSSTCRKMKRAYKHVRLSSDTFDELNSAASSAQIARWKEMERSAVENRRHDLSAMDVYAPLIRKAPTKADIHQDLITKEGGSSPIRGSASWLASGISIQEAQVELAAAVQKMGCRPTAEQLNQVEERRRRLDARIDTFEASAQRYLIQDADYDTVFGDDDDPLWEDDFYYATVQAQADNSNGSIDAKKQYISLPSMLGSQQCSKKGYKKIQAEELELRIGQANDNLQQIRIALGHKSFLYRTEVRNNKSQNKKTRSWSQVGHVKGTVQKNSWLYKHCCQAMQRLGASAELLFRYRNMERDDLKITTSVVDDPAAHGTRQKSLIIDCQCSLLINGFTWMLWGLVYPERSQGSSMKFSLPFSFGNNLPAMIGAPS